MGTLTLRDRAEQAWMSAVAVDLRFYERHEPGDWKIAIDAWDVAGDAAEEANDAGSMFGARDLARWWRGRYANAAPPGAHVHACPECYENKPCAFTCTVEPDLALDDGTPRGAHVTCDDCLAASPIRPVEEGEKRGT